MSKLVKVLPLNDRTKGFRFRFGPIKGIYRKRSLVKRPFSFDTHGDTTVSVHYGLRSFYVEYQPVRAFYNWVRG